MLIHLLAPASIDGRLVGWGAGALVVAGICVFLAVTRNRKAYFAGTVIGLVVGVLWLISAFTQTIRTEQLTVTDRYYTYGHCTEQAGTPLPTGISNSCGTRNNTLINYVKTNHGTFEDPPDSLYYHLQVGRTYSCRVKHYSSVVAPEIQSCKV